MNFLPENRILKALVVMSTIAVMICYAWLTAHLLEPSFSLPTSLVSDTFIRTTDSKLFLFEDRYRAFPLETSRLDSELSELQPLIDWLEPLKRPVEIVIDEKAPDRILVTDTRIEIGRTILLARGQLSKAVLKSWILQHASTDITTSHLRTEIASDVLLAMLKGEFELEVPGTGDSLAFDTTGKAWWSFADSYSGMCGTPWKSLELAPLCEKKDVKADTVNVSALSFRPFLDARIWKSYTSTPIRERLPFIRKWAEALRSKRALAQTTLKDGWLAIVQTELEAMLPSEIDPLLNERRNWTPKIEAPLIVIDSAGRIAAPGTLKISSDELKFEHARMAILTACIPPSLQDVLSLPVAVDRVVWRPECKERKADFVQARPSAIRIAIERGLARKSDKLDEFVRLHRSTAEVNQLKSHLLGLADAKWDEQASAYQVHGAIEAVESFRLGIKN